LLRNDIVLVLWEKSIFRFRNYIITKAYSKKIKNRHRLNVGEWFRKSGHVPDFKGGIYVVARPQHGGVAVVFLLADILISETA
jgi:hypothetical protein